MSLSLRRNLNLNVFGLRPQPERHKQHRVREEAVSRSFTSCGRRCRCKDAKLCCPLSVAVPACCIDSTLPRREGHHPSDDFRSLCPRLRGACKRRTMRLWTSIDKMFPQGAIFVVRVFLVVEKIGLESRPSKGLRHLILLSQLPARCRYSSTGAALLLIIDRTRG